jgi:hypothetical protein
VENLTNVSVKTLEQATSLINAGLQYRIVGSQKMNSVSSRSHTLLNLNLIQKFLNQSNEQKFISSSFTFIDLAGSERVKKSNSLGIRLEEAKSINTSLTALTNVIQALAAGEKYIPYRSSKLTRILQGYWMD